jgi:glycosyltransferase involved in cell wall biosynthesis
VRPVARGDDHREASFGGVRVVVVSAWEPWREGDGACLVLHAHLRELAARHDLVLLSAGAPARRADPPPTVPVPTRWYGRTAPAPLDALRRRLVRGSEPAHVGFVARPALLADLAAEVRRHRPDVVHLFGWGTAGLGPAGVPAVHDAVDPWAANLANRRRGRLAGLLDAGERSRVAAHERRHYPGLRAVVVRTAEDAALLSAQVPGARVRVVPNGVDLPPPGEPSSDPVLAFLGSYDATSNADAARVLVEQVLPLVRLEVPEASVLLVGRDPGPEVRRLAVGYPAVVTGRVPDVAAALRRAAVFVAPMVSGLGVKNKVLEAMAAGLPVVASSLAVQGIGGSEGVLVADDPQSQADAVVALLRDPARRRALGQANRDRVAAELTWAASARALEQVWEEAACGSTS